MKNKNGSSDQTFARGVENEVGPQHARDGPGRADERLDRRPVDGRVPVGGDVTAEQVEEQVRDLAEPVLDVVAEDDKEQHVPEQVQPARVQEHRVQHRQGGLLVIGRPADVAGIR